MRLCFLILTKNEEAGIRGLLDDIRMLCRRELPGATIEIVLSDDSSDGTPALARASGAHVVSGGGRGLGAAYANGLKACLRLDPERIVVLDGDGQADLGDLPRFLAEQDRSGADMVTGSRFSGGSIDYEYPLLNRTGVWLLSRYLTLMTGQTFSDSHGGLRVLTAKVAATQRVYGTHTYVQESIVDAVERGFKVVELPCHWRRRSHGSSRVVASVPRYVARTLPFLMYRAVRKLRAG